MKKTYLKPVVLSMDVVVESMIATSGELKPGKPGRGAKEQQGDWDNIWSGGGSN